MGVGGCYPAAWPTRETYSSNETEQLPQKGVWVTGTAELWGGNASSRLFSPGSPGGAGPGVPGAAERVYLCPLASPTGSAVCLQGARAGLSGDRGITDLLSAGAHHRLLLSRPPPRRTVRTLLEKQNWGVRHRGLPNRPTPALGDGGPSGAEVLSLGGTRLGQGELLWGSTRSGDSRKRAC